MLFPACVLSGFASSVFNVQADDIRLNGFILKKESS